MPIYKPNEPQATSIIAQSQIDIQGNFQTAFSAYGLGGAANLNVGDHVPFDETDENSLGGHKKLTLVRQGSDPAVATDQLNVFGKLSGSQTELFYRRDGDAAGNKLTGQGRLSANGLVLRAFVCFDGNGKILETRRVNNEGEVENVEMKLNIRSVATNLPPFGDLEYADYTITFETAMPTADYIWMVDSFNSGIPVTEAPFLPRRGNIQVKNGASYSDSVTTSSIKIAGYWIPSASTPSLRQILRVSFHAYTVG